MELIANRLYERRFSDPLEKCFQHITASRVESWDWEQLSIYRILPYFQNNCVCVCMCLTTIALTLGIGQSSVSERISLIHTSLCPFSQETKSIISPYKFLWTYLRICEVNHGGLEIQMEKVSQIPILLNLFHTEMFYIYLLNILKYSYNFIWKTCSMF